MSRRALPILLFVSGAAALVYEVLWVRLLGLVVGNTVLATTTVLGAFMAGLALGSFAAGRWLSPPRLSPLRTYALFEVGIAGWALLLPSLLALPIPLYRELYGGAWLGVARIACSFAVLLPATALMGATLPVLAQAVAGSATAGRAVGLLYVVNTLGGVTGTLVCGFWSLPALGTDGTAMLAIALNLVVAAVAWPLGRGPDPVAGAERNPTGARSVHWASVAIAATFISGLVALALEVVWTRVLNQVFGSTTYSFSLVLATFLTGIALGSEAIRRRADATRAPVLWMGLVLAATAVSVLLLAFSVEALPVLYLRVIARVGVSFKADLLARAAVAATFLLPPTVLFGAMFPLAVRTHVARRGTGRGVGEVYAANTLGAILGSALGGFVLLPLLGMQRSVEVLAVALAVAGVAVVLWSGESTRVGRVLAAAVVVGAVGVLLALSARWDRKLISSGVYMDPEPLLSSEPAVALRHSLTHVRLLHFAEGVASTVSVLDVEGALLSFQVDGKAEISTLPADRRLGRLMGHLPVLVHPRPRTALNIGLGAGFTVGALTRYSELTRIDVAELEPEAAGVARVFAAHNHDVLSDPRVRLVFNDGCNHLLLSGERYDVITSDPFEPTVTGAASLFTREHFELLRRSLAPGGVACQWLPLYELGPREYGSVLTAFVESFPYVTAWFTGKDTLLIGTEHAPRIDYADLAARISSPSVHADLEDVGLADAARLLGTFLFEATAGRSPGPAVAANTDRAPYLEFAAPRRRWQFMLGFNVAMLRLLKQALPEWIAFPDASSRQRTEAAFLAQRWAMDALVAWRSRGVKAAHPAAQEALRLDPGDPFATEVMVDWHVRKARRARKAGRIGDEIGDLEQALALDPRAEAPLFALARGALLDRRWPEAHAWLARALAVHPESLTARLILAAVHDGTNQTAEAEEILEGLLSDFPACPEVLVPLADLEKKLGNRDEARAHLRQAVAIAPHDRRVREAVARVGL